MKKVVDIIIPIYNALEDLKICLESLYKNTDLVNNRLVLINDNSSDENIKPFLNQQVDSTKNIIVIHNETNKGFSANINIGMSQSGTNDVILLNSDTVLTKNWVEKMQNCAYSSTEIGTVTPLSNNATLCSVPKFCEENKLPDYLTIDQAGEIVEKYSLKEYPRITVAHGFCMYVKREVIETIGDFDEKTFERGYGEENDFCNRAEQAGYIHVMCDDTYIYHSGTKSFVSKEKEEYIRQHDIILHQRYPKQMQGNAVHVRDNPNSKISQNVGFFFDLHNGKKNLLYLVQSDFRDGASDNIGGTQYHVRDMVEGMIDKYNVFVVAKDHGKISVTSYINKKTKIFIFDVLDNETYFKFTDRKQNEFWRKILCIFNIDIIHVHHTHGMSFDVFYVADELNIPVILTLHDYYFICPNIKMLDDNGKVCIGNNDIEACKICLNQTLSITDQIPAIDIWRRKCLQCLQKVKEIIVPSNCAKNIILTYYPEIADKISVIKHGYKDVHTVDFSECIESSDIRANIEKCERIDNGYILSGWAYNIFGNCNESEIWVAITDSEGSVSYIPAKKINRLDVSKESDRSNCGFSIYIPQNIILNNKEITVEIIIREKYENIKTGASTIKLNADVPRRKSKLNIAFIGGINKAKGGEVIKEIVERGPKEVDWFVFGGIGSDKLMELETSNLIKTGYYKPEQLTDLLKSYEIDLICIMSIWPETYSYTLTEAVLNKIPVIVTDIGAHGERTKEYDYGWTVDVAKSVEETIRIIKDIVDNPDILAKKKSCLDRKEISDLQTMHNQYKEMYNTYENSGLQNNMELVDVSYLWNSKQVNASEQQMYSIQLFRKYEKAYFDLEHMKNTIGYRIMKKLQRVKFPGKKKLELLIKSYNGTVI